MMGTEGAEHHAVSARRLHEALQPATEGWVLLAHKNAAAWILMQRRRRAVGGPVAAHGGVELHTRGAHVSCDSITDFLQRGGVRSSDHCSRLQGDDEGPPGTRRIQFPLAVDHVALDAVHDHAINGERLRVPDALRLLIEAGEMPTRREQDKVRVDIEVSEVVEVNALTEYIWCYPVRGHGNDVDAAVLAVVDVLLVKRLSSRARALDRRMGRAAQRAGGSIGAESRTRPLAASALHAGPRRTLEQERALSPSCQRNPPLAMLEQTIVPLVMLSPASVFAREQPFSGKDASVRP